MKMMAMVVGAALDICAGSAMGQDAPPLTCHDATEIIDRQPPDAFYLASLASPVRETIKNLDADLIGEGGAGYAQNWTPDGMTGQVMAVLLSCRAHPKDTLKDRATASFKAYVARQQP